MSSERCTVRQASELLSMTEQEVIALAEARQLTALSTENGYLRFDKTDIITYRKTHKKNAERITFGEHVYDFFYYNDFYLMAFLIIAVLAAMIVFT